WTNFLPAERLDRAQARVRDWSVKLPSGLDVGPICASVRPEHVEINGGAGAGRLSLEASVLDVTYLGNFCLCELNARDEALQARVPADRAPAPGTTVTASFDSARLRILADDDVQPG
ncbi:MAG: TOBE domain-containing protein, partial [Alphaproteobacteria bacterium]|nr:TOBE domain-containing protein [Alphaproteobacteria bacterium]